MTAIHADWFYVAVISTGAVGLWGIVLAIVKRPPNCPFRVAAGAAVVAMLVQIAFGLISYGQGNRPGDDFHLFYGFVVLFTFTFSYIYRAQLARRPALGWGLLLLFVMGLGLRAWSNVG